MKFTNPDRKHGLISKSKILSAFKDLFRKNKSDLINLPIKFYKDANPFGEHGKLVVSHIQHGLNNEPVSFVFAGLTVPPRMTVDLIGYIWDEAEHMGYMPHYVAQYGTENEIMSTPVLHRNRNKDLLELKPFDVDVKWFNSRQHNNQQRIVRVK